MSLINPFLPNVLSGHGVCRSNRNTKTNILLRLAQNSWSSCLCFPIGSFKKTKQKTVFLRALKIIKILKQGSVKADENISTMNSKCIFFSIFLLLSITTSIYLQETKHALINASPPVVHKSLLKTMSFLFKGEHFGFPGYRPQLYFRSTGAGPMWVDLSLRNCQAVFCNSC